MATLNEISGIGEASLQLLDAAGIASAEDLLAQDMNELIADLKRVNESLALFRRPPGKSTVTKWIVGATELLETHAGKKSSPATPKQTKPGEAAVQPVNYEANLEVGEMLLRSPCAIPLPGKVMMERGLGVSDVPAGILLNRYSGDLDVRVDDPANPRAEVPARRSSGNMETVSTQMERRQFDGTSAKAFTPSGDSGKRMPKSNRDDVENRVALIRAPREETNRGKNPESRRFVRGVLHTHPWGLRVGAISALLLLINLPLAMVSAFLLLVSREAPEAFAWVPEWILAFPIALPITGLGYLFWGVSGKCRICTQKLFVHKGALKHIKSHRFPGMGFVVPLCLHLLAFGWFRCSSCGTPVRLKK
jgi:hypothetical protein